MILRITVSTKQASKSFKMYSLLCEQNMLNIFTIVKHVLFPLVE